MSEKPNPYAPPAADLHTAPAPHAKGSAWKAVLVAFLVDMGLSLILGTALAVAYGVYLAAIQTPLEEIERVFTGGPSQSRVLLVGMLVLGGAASIFGGYVCSRMARHSELRLGAILTAVLLVFGWIITGEDEPREITMLSSLTTILCVMTGSLIGARRNRRTG